ncbi:hypothetical protein PBAL39_08070 [Pedobacter sp. BAL39]|uniref:hypothetical protein n=1 Tax=Pedobacter sp. BAL39 TaxID=391596 RepID=UPI000155996A|nr:hypothetical protein [Pedobacter sp. BAL39]EDM35019.1 hypothetical protein PBAL39_08070 [Pedobacter sp. BAL39]
MGDAFHITTILALIGCLILGMLLAYLFYRRTPHLEPKLRIGLAVLRALTITIIGWLLFFPLVKKVSYTLQKPLIIIGQDNSLSVNHVSPPDFDRKAYETQLQALAKRLSSEYEVKVYNFSDSIKPGFDFKNQGKLSNATTFLNRLKDEYLNRNVGAVILASDGIFNSGGSPLYDIQQLKAPIYTVALGDTIPRRDVSVANVNYNNLVYLNNEFTIELQAEAFESKGARSRISVTEDGKEVYQGSLDINTSAFAKTISIPLKATKTGLRKYVVSLSPIGNEVSEQNNTRQFFIEVIDGRQKILIAAGAAHPDIATIRQSLAAHKNYELKVAVAEELNALDPKDFGLVILYQLPDVDNHAAAFLQKLGSVNTPVWYVIGAQSNTSRFNQLQSQVSFSGNNNTLQEAFAEVNADFTQFGLDAGAVKVINGFDPLQVPMGVLKVNGNGMIALSQRIGKIKTGAPQLFFMNENGRKSGYLMGEGIWRWKLSEAKDGITPSVVNNLLSQTVQYLVAKDDLRKFKVTPSKNTFNENEHVLINAVLYNDSYVAVNTPDVNIRLKNQDGKIFTFLFSRTSAAYQLDAGLLPAGNYTFNASTTLGDKKYQADGAFYINAMVLEYQQTIANHQLLSNMSQQTNGKMYMPRQLSAIADDLKANEQIKTLSFEDRKYEELINFKWLFAMVMFLLTLEWFFRKRNGEI